MGTTYTNLRNQVLVKTLTRLALLGVLSRNAARVGG